MCLDEKARTVLGYRRMDNDDEFNKMKQYLHVGAILKLYNKIKIICS